MIDYGVFRAYVPDPLPAWAPAGTTVLFVRSESGEDFYDVRRRLEAEVPRTYLYVVDDVVRGTQPDAGLLFPPDGYRLIGIDPVEDHASLRGKRLDADGTFHDVPPPAPTSCSRLGLKRAFDELGLWPTVRAMIEADADRAEEWSLATVIRRADPLVQGAIAALTAGGVAVDVDALLVRANALTA